MLRSAATTVLVVTDYPALAQSASASRTWDCDLKGSDVHTLQIGHDAERLPTEVQIIADQSFLPLIFDIPSVTHLRTIGVK